MGQVYKNMLMWGKEVYGCALHGLGLIWLETKRLNHIVLKPRLSQVCCVRVHLSVKIPPQ